MFVLGLIIGGTVGFVIYALCFVAGTDAKQTSDSSKDCKWCKNHKGESVLQFSVVKTDRERLIDKQRKEDGKNG